MKRRWNILIGVAVLCLISGACLVVTMHVRPADQLEAYERQLRDQGEKLEFAEALPPPPAPEDNSLGAAEKAFQMLDPDLGDVPNAMHMVAPGKALVGWMQPDARGSDFTNSWDDYAAKLEAERPAIALLHQVLDRPTLDFRTDNQIPETSLFTNLAPMKRAALWLDAAAILDLHRGDVDGAATNILTMLALVQRNAVDGLEICHLVRLAIAGVAVGSTWELLQATNVTDRQLAAVGKAWQQLDFLKDAENALVWERAWAMNETQKSRGSHQGFTNVFDPVIQMAGSDGASGTGSELSGWLADSARGPRAAIGEALWRSSWSYADELQTVETMQIALEAIRKMRTNGSGFYKADLDAMASRLSPFTFTNSSSVLLDELKIPDYRAMIGDPAPGAMLRKTLRLITARNVVLAAIALKRFHLKQGVLPETLSDLAPGYLPSVPIDPYDGKPLKYHCNADGAWVLYSVGLDGADGGGDPTTSDGSRFFWQNPRAHDWVWPQPATAAEARFYYEHPPKQ